MSDDICPLENLPNKMKKKRAKRVKVTYYLLGTFWKT